MNLRRLVDPVVTIEDDRGDRHAYDVRKRAESKEQRMRLREIGKQLQRARVRKPLVWKDVPFVLLILAIVVCFGAVAMVVPRPLHLVLYPLLGLAGGYLGLRWASVTQRDRIVEAYKGIGICPCCGFSLGGVSPGADGFTTCPECGAAWRLSDGGAALQSRE